MFLWTTPIYRGRADYNTARVLAGTRQNTCTPLNEIKMTKSRLGVDLEDKTGKTAYTEYNMFG